MTDTVTTPPEATPTGSAALARMREPFDETDVLSRPQPYCKKCSNSPEKHCDQHQKKPCRTCGQTVTTAHFDLSYVGHAALTNRLLDADERWTWEPVAWTDEGLPRFDRDGGLWIRLTIDGVPRLGYGDAQGKSGPNATKEVIGDALRNAGMRFGAALELWHKGDLSKKAAGVSDDDLEDARPARAARQAQAENLPQYQPEQPAKPVELSEQSDATQLRIGIKDAAEAGGFGLVEVASVFRTWTQGTEIGVAEPKVLWEFLTKLRAKPAETMGTKVEGS